MPCRSLSIINKFVCMFLCSGIRFSSGQMLERKALHSDSRVIFPSNFSFSSIFVHSHYIRFSFLSCSDRMDKNVFIFFHFSSMNPLMCCSCRNRKGNSVFVTTTKQTKHKINVEERNRVEKKNVFLLLSYFLHCQAAK